MDAQQLATKVAQLESRVATLEDEGKIVKGEVKQILTEIRTAILVRDNPFEGDGGLATAVSAPAPIVVATPQAPAPAPRPEPAPLPPAARAEPPAPPEPAPAREPVMLRPVAPTPAPSQPAWSLLTIAGLSAWAEDAMRLLGALRLEILLDLVETAGHITTEARTALSRVSELDIAEPAQAPSTNETVTLLRQLDALINDSERGSASLRLARL